MNKKILFAGLTTLSALALTGCSSNKPVANLEVNSESYIIQKDDKNKDNKEATLALEVTLKNTTKKSLDNIYQGDFSLYDKDGNQISPSTGVYDLSGDFQTMSGFSLNPDKKKTEYLAFKVDRGEKYELHYKPAIYDKSNKDPKDSIVEIDTSKANDASSEVKKLTASYVNQVFLNKTEDAVQWETKDDTVAQNVSTADDKKEESKLDIDVKKAKENFNAKFSELFVSDLQSSGSTYEPTSDELKKVISAVQERNFSEGSVEYNVAELFPTSAIVYVKPKVMDFNTIDMSDFLYKKMDKIDTTDRKKALDAAAKIVVQQLPAEIGKASVSTPNSMSKEGYKLVLSKTKEGKWKFDNSDSSDNYDYTDLESAFMAGE